MRLLLAIIVIIYLIGVGVVLSPIIRATWNIEPASVLADHVIQALPRRFRLADESSAVLRRTLNAKPGLAYSTIARVQPAERRLPSPARP